MTTFARVKKSSKHQKKSANDEPPVFLKKTYHMIDSCDPTLGSWSDDGKSFVVKDHEQFASKVIPQFFKHNNFSSFVRQLNFYGFRKIKRDPLKIDLALEEVEAKYWRFRHDYFVRGRPDLLKEIRKPVDTNSDQQEIETLKQELTIMKGSMEGMHSYMNQMSSQIAHLTSLALGLQQEKGCICEAFPSSKKIRIDVSQPFPSQNFDCNIQNIPQSYHQQDGNNASSTVDENWAFYNSNRESSVVSFLASGCAQVAPSENLPIPLPQNFSNISTQAQASTASHQLPNNESPIFNQNQNNSSTGISMISRRLGVSSDPQLSVAQRNSGQCDDRILSHSNSEDFQNKNVLSNVEIPDPTPVLSDEKNMQQYRET